VRTIADLKPAAYVGTPSFLKILLDRAAEQGIDVGSVRRRWSAPKRFPRYCAASSERGINALQSYGTADLGLIYESTGPDGESAPAWCSTGNHSRAGASRHRRSGRAGRGR
jgi:phenylacetate-CoA ligase